MRCSATIHARAVVVCALSALGACSEHDPPGAAAGGSSSVGQGGSAGAAGAGTGAGTGSAGNAAAGASSASGASGVGGASAGAGGSSGAAGGPGLPVPDKQQYLALLVELDDLLISTQITDVADANYGALLSPSTNPDEHPTHSRAAEAVYPLAVAYKHLGDEKYADAAIELGNWLIPIQQPSGAWGEDWPLHDGWDGTTADQLISLAGAYEILEPLMSVETAASWSSSITSAADWIVLNFPKGNVNYFPTGAVALVLADRALLSSNQSWLDKADSLMTETLAGVTADDFITGEGLGVDVGYNVAQSIGYIALYGLLVGDAAVVDEATAIAQAHLPFVYPNGAIDNSWGTRSYKWMFESGTKTAPGVLLSWGLLADRDPSLQRSAQLALSFMQEHSMDEAGWVSYGPHAFRHPTSSPPSNYSTFARAQSIATVIEFGTDTPAVAAIPADGKNWFEYIAAVETGVLRTDKVMATVTAYAANAEYPRDSVVRGGSATLVWFEGYGATGILQASSQTNYQRIEDIHMPIETDLLPLTPRVETTSGTFSANVLDDMASLALEKVGTEIVATSSGQLRSADGTGSGVTFSWLHRFGPDSYTKELTLSATANLRIVEPFVDNPGNEYALTANELTITTAEGGVWALTVDTSSGDVTLTGGEDRERYWSPFPGVDCYPLVIQLSASSAATIKYTIHLVTAPAN